MKKVMAFLFGALLLLSCDSDSSTEYNCEMMHYEYFLTVTDEAGSPVALDSFKVTWDGVDITYEYKSSEGYERAKEKGQYIIVTDLMQKELERKDANLLFTGYISDKVVIGESFLFTANECHVSYVDTKSLTIVLPK